MRGSRKLTMCVTGVLALVLLYQFAPGVLFSPLGKMLLAYMASQAVFLILPDAHEEPHDHPRADPPALARTGDVSTSINVTRIR